MKGLPGIKVVSSKTNWDPRVCPKVTKTATSTSKGTNHTARPPAACEWECAAGMTLEPLTASAARRAAERTGGGEQARHFAATAGTGCRSSSLSWSKEG